MAQEIFSEALLFSALSVCLSPKAFVPLLIPPLAGARVAGASLEQAERVGESKQGYLEWELKHKIGHPALSFPTSIQVQMGLDRNQEHTS